MMLSTVPSARDENLWKMRPVRKGASTLVSCALPPAPIKGACECTAASVSQLDTDACLKQQQAKPHDMDQHAFWLNDCKQGFESLRPSKGMGREGRLFNESQ